jgi:hypothetical protein
MKLSITTAAYLTASLLLLFTANIRPAYCAPVYNVVPIINPTNHQGTMLPGLKINNRGDVPVVWNVSVQGVEQIHAGYVDVNGLFHDIHAWDNNIYSDPALINNQRQVVGYLTSAYSSIHSIFRYTPWLGIEDFGLPTLGSPPYPNIFAVNVTDINNLGAFIGYSLTNTSGTTSLKGFCLGCSNLTELTGYYFRSMNDTGQILATDQYANNLYIVKQDQSVQNISQQFQPYIMGMDAHFIALKITNRKSVLVTLLDEYMVRQSKVLDGLSGVVIKIVSPFSGGICSQAVDAVAMNNNDVVTGGYSFFNGTGCSQRSFVWDKFNGFRDLDTLIDPQLQFGIREVLAINDRGDILVMDAGGFSLLRPILPRIVPKPVPLPVPVEPILGEIEPGPVEPIEDPMFPGPATE